MGKQLKIKSGHIVLVNKKKIDRFPPKKEEVRVKKVSGKNENLTIVAKKRKKKISAKREVYIPYTPSKQYEFGERLHPDEWYEEKCPYCNTVINKSKNMCEFCGHDKQEEEEKIDIRSRHIPSRVRLEVWRRDFGKCVECGSKERLEYDHIIPFSKGGSNTARNIQLLCEDCNRKKSSNIEFQK